jgi:hypothetical protein
MYDFIADLDEFFCDRYENYDKICTLEGYKMPKMQATKTDEFGREVGYTLPKTEMRLALQTKKCELLAQLKATMIDKSFSFSFTPYKWTELISHLFTPNVFHKVFTKMLAKNHMSKDEARSGLTVRKEIWDGICNGKFAPTKNLLFSMAFALQLSMAELKQLMWVTYEKFDFAEVKDVVVYYLIDQGIYTMDKVHAAFAEYKIENLFLE